MSIRTLLFIFIFMFAGNASAAVYTWTLHSSHGDPTLYSSARAACDAYEDWVIALPRYKTFTQLVPNRGTDPTPMLCRIYSASTPGGNAQLSHSILIFRSGTSCPPESTGYDLYEGTCIMPEPTACEADAGRTFPYSKTGTWPDAFITVQQSSGGLFYGTQQTACSSGCQISVISPACKVGTDGSYTCRGEALTTGAECVAGTGTSTDPGDPTVTEGDTTLPPPAPETIVDQIPCAYGLDAAVGGLKCISSNSVEKEGTTCGIFNGVNVCTTKQPVNDTTTIETTIVDTANPDGSTTTTKTDKATVTKCVGANCESKESTTSTNTTKDGNGTTTSSTTTCLGEACIGNSETGGESEGECLVDCDTFGTPDLDEVASFGDSVTNFTDRIAAAPLLSSISSIGLNGSGSCSFPSASTMIGEISFNSICENSGWLDPLFYVFLALWAFTAVRVLLSA
jgi:hypothetical protein